MMMSLEGVALEGASVKLFKSEDKTVIRQGTVDSNGETPVHERIGTQRYTAIAGYDEWSSSFADLDSPIEGNDMPDEYPGDSEEDGREEELEINGKA